MSTLTLEHLTEPQRAALQGPEPTRAANRFEDLANRFNTLATLARLADRPETARILRGYGQLAADLADTADFETLTERAA